MTLNFDQEILDELTKELQMEKVMTKVLPVYTFDHPIIRSVCVEVKERTEEIDQLVNNMVETMYKAKGIGLAANQVGSLHRLFVIDNGLHNPHKNSAVVINPEIIEVDEIMAFGVESCLSLPKIEVEVKRPMQVRIKYLDEKFNEQEFETSDSKGMIARVIFHEIDHLCGKLIIDYLETIDAEMQRKLNNIAHGSNTKYLTINK